MLVYMCERLCLSAICFSLSLSAVASAWRCARGCWLRTASSVCVWPAETRSGPRLPAPPCWLLTPTQRWTCCTSMWALCSQCSRLLRRSKPGKKPLIRWPRNSVGTPHCIYDTPSCSLYDFNNYENGTETDLIFDARLCFSIGTAELTFCI